MNIFSVLLSIIIVTQVLVGQLRAIENEIDWKSYQPTISYKPEDISALDWVKKLELEFEKKPTHTKEKPSFNFQKQIRQEISSTIAGKYGISEIPATLEETENILKSVFKTARYFRYISFREYYLSYNREQEKEKLESKKKFSKHLAFICAAHYTSHSDHKTEGENSNKKFYIEATLSVNNSEIQFLQPITRYCGSFRYSPYCTAEKFSIFMKEVYLQSSSESVVIDLLNMLSVPEWSWLLKIAEHICPKGPNLCAKFDFNVCTERTYFEKLLSKNEILSILETKGIDIKSIELLGNYLEKIRQRINIPLLISLLPIFQNASKEEIKTLIEGGTLLEKFEKGFWATYTELIQELEKAQTLFPSGTFQKIGVFNYSVRCDK